TVPLTDIAKYPFGGKQDFECSIAVREADLDFRVVLPPGRDPEFRRRRYRRSRTRDGANATDGDADASDAASSSVAHGRFRQLIDGGALPRASATGCYEGAQGATGQSGAV